LSETGGHFKPHKDTVKQEGMFGTLVLQLPCSFESGASDVSHQGETKHFEVSKDCGSSFQYTAFYGDCKHKIQPITNGWRLCLVYNLVVTRPKPDGVLPNFGSYKDAYAELQDEAKKWSHTETGMMGYPLEHDYGHLATFGKLKGRDAAVASVLCHAKDPFGDRLFDTSLVCFAHARYRSFLV